MCWRGCFRGAALGLRVNNLEDLGSTASAWDGDLEGIMDLLVFLGQFGRELVEESLVWERSWVPVVPVLKAMMKVVSGFGGLQRVFIVFFFIGCLIFLPGFFQHLQVKS